MLTTVHYAECTKFFLCTTRFVDRDGDGFISADDIFALQAMLMQRSEIFLRVSKCALFAAWSN
jgi:hypothetical protein